MKNRSSSPKASPKKRIQITTGPKVGEILVKIARKTNLETGIPVTAVEVLEAAATVGLNKMAGESIKGFTGVSTLRE